MKAKPGAKPAAKPSGPAPKAAAVAAKPAAGKPTAPKPTLPGDDLPFESELTTGKPAIPALPSPTKQRTLQVICPMCDTPGYLPPTAAGQNVRCANPKCVMPVFTAPAEKKKEVPPPPPPPKPSNLPMIFGITGAAVLLIGAGIFFAFLPSNKPKEKQLSEEEKQLLAEMAGGNKQPAARSVPGMNSSSPDAGLSDPKAGKKEPGQEKTPAGLDITKILKQMKDSSLAAEKQRSKPYCRQLSAEANAVTGNPGAAREHLDQLLKVGPELSYYRIVPLLDLFWAEFDTDKKAAAKTLETAFSEVPKLPKFGRTRFEIVGRLIAALAAAGRTSDALGILSKIESSDPEAQLAARLQRATDGRVAPLAETDTVLPWKHPQAAAATFSLITRGQLAAAAAWAAAQSSDEAKSECLAVWAQELMRLKSGSGELDGGGEIAAAVEKLSPAFAARVWARAGCGRVQAKDPQGAAKAIALAQEQLAKIAVPAEIDMPALKQTLKYKRPAAEPLLQAAVAAGELAFLQAQSAETKADAEKSLDLALSFVRGTSPTIAAASQRQEDAERQGAGIRGMLKKELNLKSDDEARTAASNYRQVLSDIVDASEQRFTVETQLLSRLQGAGVGLASKVWVDVNARSTADNINRKDNFFATGLPGQLIESLKGTDEERAIRGAWSLYSREEAPPRPPLIQFQELLAKAEFAKAAQFLESIDNKAGRREEILLQTTSDLASKNQLSVVFQMISKLDSLVAREECYRLACALGAQRGQSDLIWNQVSQVGQQTEKVAICRGLIAGMQTADKLEETQNEMSGLR